MYQGLQGGCVGGRFAGPENLSGGPVCFIQGRYADRKDPAGFFCPKAGKGIFPFSSRSSFDRTGSAEYSARILFLFCHFITAGLNSLQTVRVRLMKNGQIRLFPLSFEITGGRM